jgi:hypothetical protein
MARRASAVLMVVQLRAAADYGTTFLIEIACSAHKKSTSAWAAETGLSYFLILPWASNCLRYAHKSFASCSFLIPANTILVPGIFAFGSLM